MEPFAPPSGPLSWIETLARLPVATIVWTMAICIVARAAAYYLYNAYGRHWLHFGSEMTAHQVDVSLQQVLAARALGFLNSLLDAIIYAGILVYLIIRPYLVQPFYIPSESMVPTLRVGDVVMVGKFSYRLSEPKRFDIVVFRAPDWALNPWQTPGKTDFVKRLIGLPGDVIEIKAGEGLYLNGKLLNEPYLNGIPQYSMKIIDGWVYEYNDFGDVWKGGEHTMRQPVIDKAERQRVLSSPSEPIPPGRYLMLGDNRNNSSDGHHWGLLDARRVVGKALFVFWPPNRIGPANRTPLPQVE
ncbi:MAG: signal peptidase I [Fimbriimonadales bacterium]|nr:signal peptidase I [Fimbriimonadales bacterium]